jgi:hypothetical protein
MQRANRLAKVIAGSMAVTLCLSALIEQRGIAQGTTSTISGRVIDGRTAQPVADATVFASTAEETVSQRTSQTGEFLFNFSKPVRIRLWADKPYLLRANAESMDIPIGARISGVLLKLSDLAAIEGRVSNGTEPVIGATLKLLRQEYRGVGAIWRLVLAKSARSDGRGVYRITGLEPGDYLVAVMAEKGLGGRTVTGNLNDPNLAGRPTFAPGTQVAATATVFTLAAGAEVTADIQQQTSETADAIEGRVLNGDRGVGGVTVRLRRQNGSGMATDLDEIGAVTDGTGAFRFSDVPVGPYKLRVVQFPESGQPLLKLGLESYFSSSFLSDRFDDSQVRPVRLPTAPFPPLPAVGGPVPPLPDAPTLYADRDVLVEARSSEPIQMQLLPAATISGRVVFQDGTRPRPEDLLTVPMLIRPAGGEMWGDIPQARIERDGTFRSPGLPPGDYVIVPLLSRSRLPKAWNAVALTSGGMDYLGGAITLTTTDVTDVVVTLSTKSAEISGTVRRPNLSPLAVAQWARVIIFPKAERMRQFYYAFPSPKRVVQAPVFYAALPPGEYLVAAIGDELHQFWMTRDYLARLVPWATPIRLGVGAKVTVALEARSLAFGR